MEELWTFFYQRIPMKVCNINSITYLVEPVLIIQ